MSIHKLARSLHPSKMASIVKCNKELRGSMISPPQSTQRQRMISFPAHCSKLPRMSFPTTPKLPKFSYPSKMASDVKYDKEIRASMTSAPQSIQKLRNISFSAHCLKPILLTNSQGSWIFLKWLQLLTATEFRPKKIKPPECSNLTKAPSYY